MRSRSMQVFQRAGRVVGWGGSAAALLAVFMHATVAAAQATTPPRNEPAAAPSAPPAVAPAPQAPVSAPPAVAPAPQAPVSAPPASEAPVRFEPIAAPPATVAAAPAPATSAPTSVAARVVEAAPAPSESLEPVRARRPFVIAGELGWNSLSGFGAVAAYHALPELALELGVGVGLAGLKGGARVRGNLLRSNWTPTVGLGLSFAGGLGRAFDIDKEAGDGREATLKVLATPHAQFTAGVSYSADSGGYFTALVGYAVLLRQKNVKLISGDPTLREDFQSLMGSGLVLSVSAGYAF